MDGSHIPHRLMLWWANDIWGIKDISNGCLGSEKAITRYLSTISMVAGMAKKRGGQIKSEHKMSFPLLDTRRVVPKLWVPFISDQDLIIQQLLFGVKWCQNIANLFML